MHGFIKTSLLSLVFITLLAGLAGGEPQLVGDLNADHVVDFKDLRAFAWQWLDPACLVPGCTADLDDVDGVNMADYALLAKNWQIEEPHIVISEFMASNINTRLDGDGESSDWIEIYNPTSIDVNMDGWYLTDYKPNLTMWQFPNGLEVKAGDFLLVFASEKTYELYPNNYPYLDSSGYYHTNFNLDKEPGEYLALVAPDGNTVVHEYAPQYPVQLTDISYGLTQYAMTLVPRGMTASYHIPTSGDAALGTDWAGVDFDDSEWDTGQTGIGFGLGGERMVAYNDVIYGSGQYIANHVTNYGISASGLLVDQTTGDNMGVTVTITQSGGVTTQSDPTYGGSDCAVGTDAYNTFGGITDMTGVLLYGNVGWWVELNFTGLDPQTEYTFATSACRGNPDYTDRWTIYTLNGADTYTNASTVGVDVLAENKVKFLTGDNYSHGYVARWKGITAADGSFTVRAEADPTSSEGRKAYSFDVFMLEGGYRGTDVEEDMLGVNASLWMRSEFNLEAGDSDIFDTLTLRMKYEDGFAAYLNGEPVTSRNAPNSVQWDSTALTDRPNEEAAVTEAINIMAHVHALQGGKNVLSIQGLNDSVSDPNFLILPELTAASNMSVPQYFVTPTPETFNIPGAKGVVSEVWFSHKRGFYNAPFQLILSTAMDDAEIRYTLDGSRPTITHGLTYTGVIDVNDTTVVRAAAVRPGWLDSKVEAHTCIFLDYVINQTNNPVGFPVTWGGTAADYEMDPDIVNAHLGTIINDMRSLPTMSLVMDLNDLFDPSIGIYSNPYGEGVAWERPCSIELLYPGGQEGFQLNCGVRIYGGVGRREKKKTLRLLFKSIYGPSKLRYPLFSEDAADSLDTLILRANFNDGYPWGGNRSQFIRDEYVRLLQLGLGQPSPHGTFVHLYINGLYWGLYNPVERPQASFAANYFGGEKEDWDALNSGSPTGESTTTTWYAMLDLVRQGLTTNDAYQRLQGNNPDGTPNPAYVDYLDVDNYIVYMLINFYVGNTDWPGHNWYSAMNRVEPSGWKSFSWDAEWVIGINSDVSVDRTGVNSSICEPYAYLRQNTEFCLLFADYAHLAFYNGGLLYVDESNPQWNPGYPERNRPASLYAYLADWVERAVVGETARWGDVGGTQYTLSQWQSQRDSILTSYMPYRSGKVVPQLRGAGLYPINLDAPVFKINAVYQHGGEVSSGDVLTMDNPPSGTIYYTTDGSDPREPVTGNAVGTPYTPLTLNKSTHVKARVLDGITWSAFNEATYAVGPVAENLRITEIMYHPKNTGDPNDPNKEFIELKNISPDILNLNLVRFTKGIDFTFPDVELAPNECVVVVRDQSAFESQYGTEVNIAGHYTGSLANDGERIKLVDAIGRTILDFEYEDGWRPVTDGGGFSLTITDPTDQTLYSWEQGLVAHWKFDDGAGVTATDSAGTNNGTLNGDPTWITGRIGGALSFDGNGDYVSVAPIGPLEGDNFTAQAWVNVDASAGVWNPVIMQHDLSNDGCYFYVSYDKPSFYIIAGSIFAQAASIEALNADQWYHVAATNDGSTLKLYVDGQLKSSGSSAGVTGVSYDAYIGCEPISLLYYIGLIDDVRIYDRAVSESEFQSISDPMARWSRKDSWRASVYRNGTPGWDDSGILPNPGAIVINEVMSHSNDGPDWIELYNTTDEPINIGGWFLSDYNRDEPNLMKYRIADGTMINGNDYLVFYQDSNFNNPDDPGCLVHFALSENGEEVCLSSHLDLNVMLTGYREVEDFGASATNVSFGRYFKSSTGNYNFVAMDYNTPDSNNAYPKVGPVVINEIMYNPPTGNQKEEYIELYNITGAAVTLWRIDKNTSWKFTDGIDLTFSSSPTVTILPYRYLLVVKDQASFTARYGIISGVQIVEDYDGWLSNSGERLQIGMPGDVDELDRRQYIRIDRVTYSDGSHPEDVPGGVDYWPFMADGFGYSLSRRVPGAYGNDVANWKGALPSPGAANP